MLEPSSVFGFWRCTHCGVLLQFRPVPYYFWTFFLCLTATFIPVLLDVAGLTDSAFAVLIAVVLALWLVAWLPARLSPIECIDDKFR